MIRKTRPHQREESQIKQIAVGDITMNNSKDTQKPFVVIVEEINHEEKWTVKKRQIVKSTGTTSKQFKSLNGAQKYGRKETLEGTKTATIKYFTVNEANRGSWDTIATISKGVCEGVQQ